MSGESVVVGITLQSYAIVSVVVLAFAGIVAAALAVAARQHREIPGSNWFAGVMATICLWSSAYAIQLSSSSAEWILLWHTVKYVAIVAAPYFWFGFTVVYGGHSRYVSRRVLVLAGIVPLASIFLVVTNPIHNVFWLSRTPNGAFAPPGDIDGPGFWLHTVYSYMLLLAGTVSLLWSFSRARELYRGQIVLLLLGTTLPWFANVVYLFGWLPVRWLDPTPVAFALSGTLFGAATYYYQLLNLSPVAWELARDVAIEDMSNGAIVLDVHDRIVDLNTTAMAVCGLSRSAVIGRQLDEVSPTCAALVERGSGEFETLVGHVWRSYEVQLSGVSTVGGRQVGRLVTLHDITERKTREQRLEVQNRLLRHNLRNDLNVVLGYLELLDDLLEDDEQRTYLHRSIAKSQLLVERAEKSRQLGKLLDREVRLREVDVVSMLELTAAACRDRFPEADITTTTPPELSALADGGLETALYELVENSVRHAGGPCRIELAATATDDTVEVSVADDGPGIPTHERTVLDSGRETPLEHGTGIGLWLVKWLATRYGGAVRIEDNEPRGTVVVLVLTRADGDNSDHPRGTGVAEDRSDKQ